MMKKATSGMGETRERGGGVGVEKSEFPNGFPVMPFSCEFGFLGFISSFACNFRTIQPIHRVIRGSLFKEKRKTHTNTNLHTKRGHRQTQEEWGRKEKEIPRIQLQEHKALAYQHTNTPTQTHQSTLLENSLIHAPSPITYFVFRFVFLIVFA